MTTIILAALLCPTGLAAPDHDTLTLPAGCAAPYEGQLYTLAAHDGVTRDIAKLDALVMGLRAARDEARAQRDACLLAAVQAPAVPTKPDWLDRVAWGAGGLVVGAILIRVAIP